MDDYGVLKEAVTVAGQVVSGGVAMIAVVTGKSAWAPAIAGLENFYNRIFGVLVGVGMVGLYIVSTYQVSASAFAITAFVAAVLGVFGAARYLRLYSDLCFRCPHDDNLYIKGWQLKTLALAVLGGNINLPKPYGPLAAPPTSAVEYFCNSGKDPDMIWDEESQSGAKVSLFAAYGVAMVLLTLALAAASYAVTQVKLEITRTPTQTRIELPADVLFDFDKADIKSSSNATLEKAAAMLRDQNITAARIEGYTDEKGSAPHNLVLSEQRAAAVYNWLINEAGLKNIKFTVQGFGATKFVAPNVKPDGSDDAAGRAKNRRVEIVFDTH
jgi:outer membrane protein OmpA-like peptidoglycan-associated protein